MSRKEKAFVCACIDNQVQADKGGIAKLKR